IPDARGRDTAVRARRFLRLPVTSCRTRDAYKVDMALSPADTRRVCRAFADPVTARAAGGRLPPPRFDWLIEVGFKPGVTDNLGHTAREAIRDVLDRSPGPREGVYTATQYFLRGEGLRREDVERLGRDLLANELIQTWRVYSPAEWAAAPPDTELPVIRETNEPVARAVDLGGADEELRRISREGVLSLDLDEMRTIRDYFARPEVRSARAALGLPRSPTDVEVECLAQTWSEHCKHKIFAARIRYVDEAGREEWIDSLFKTYIRGATERIGRDTDRLVSVFTDNAGIIRFNERYHLAYKVETHNTPSALDPYGGAITGIVGVNRDLIGAGMGCELLCNTWGYCFASPFHDGPVPEGLMHPHRIRDGVHQGVIDGGNQSGIPWARGFERFDERFLGKPLVFCGTVGRIPRTLQDRPSERKEVFPGDLIVMCGGRIGKDGIHGATFSSEALRKESPAQAVQIGDPITQRRMYEFLIEARDLGLYRAITDNGAGGLSSSVGEMSRLSGGAELDLARAPLKYEGLQPWEILLSEAQERMTLAVPPEHVAALQALARRHDVEATVLGRFTDSGALVVRYGDPVVGRLDLDFLHEGCPRLTLEARWTPPSIPRPARPRPGARTGVLLELLRSLNVCSKEYKSRRYDAEVKGLSVVKPFVGAHADMPADATVMRVEHGRREGVILAEGIHPFLSDLDPYAMAASAVDEAVRRVISAGGSLDRIAGLDNFCWPDPMLSEKTPDGPFKLAQLVRANRALYDVTTAYGVPCISGKDSMKNDSVRGGKKISIPPTLLFSTLGILDDVRRAVTPDFKRAGDWIYAIGLTRAELGASEYHRVLAARQGRPGAVGGEPPSLDVKSAPSLYRAMARATQAGLLRSSHTPTLGGLAVALALAAMGGDLGADVDLSAAPATPELDDDALLFSESNSRFVVTCAPEGAAALEALFKDLPCGRIGTVTTEPRLQVRGTRGRRRVNCAVERLRHAFKETLHGF
ncbi:MAG: phosphoribosylformylglycinamidine synthase, partial [Verrucomicrobia bacterium]|nr:phosphoribosylformylglycinamidine synthase [Verrucomicrobiota bacterium]